VLFDPFFCRNFWIKHGNTLFLIYFCFFIRLTTCNKDLALAIMVSSSVIVLSRFNFLVLGFVAALFGLVLVLKPGEYDEL
jgi:hypothetical protein